jgi:hypothetical protein
MRAAGALLAALLAAPAAAQATVPFEVKEGLVVVRARVDKWDRAMVLDTGSAYTVIAEAGRSGKERPRDTPGGLLVKGRTRTATVQLGGVPPVRMTVLEVNMSDPRFEGIGGIIGQDLLSHLGSVKIDYRARTVEFAPKEGKVSNTPAPREGVASAGVLSETLTHNTQLTGTANSSDLGPSFRGQHF